jgi:capsular polysaccharide biosynthesis protein
MVVKTNEIYKCKKAIYINHIHTSGIHTKMGSWGKDILKPCISSRISTDNKYLVYLSRDGLPKRVFSSIQEKELIEFLNIIAIKNSLELKVINNPKTPDEVIDIINKSHIIIGIHGGAFANMIYCNINTRIVEIIQKDKLEERPCFYYLASSLGLKYTYLEPESFNFEGNVILNMKKTYEILKTL